MKPSNEDEATNEEDYPLLVKRAEWEARSPQSTTHMVGPVADVVFTETDTQECRKKKDCMKLIRQIQNYHMDVRGLPDIQHSFLIGGDGNVYEGRGWRTSGPEYGKNQTMPERLTGKSIEIAFIGKYKDSEPTGRMLKVATSLVRYGRAKKLISDRMLEEERKEKEEKEEENEEKKEEDKEDEMEMLELN